MPKTGKTKKRPRSKSFPVLEKPLKKGTQLNSQLFRWSFSKCLWEHGGWTKECKGIKHFWENIIAKLQHHESMTWQDILNASGGKGDGRGNNSHFIPADRLPRNEQKEFIHLDYMRDYEKVFSLRLSGTERLVGVVDSCTLFVLWYDARHNFF